jgi:hypothetical protein
MQMRAKQLSMQMQNAFQVCAMKLPKKVHTSEERGMRNDVFDFICAFRLRFGACPFPNSTKNMVVAPTTFWRKTARTSSQKSCRITAAGLE